MTSGVYTWVATAVCISGTVVNVWRYNACFALWFVGEIMWAVFDVMEGLWSRMVLDLLGLALAALGAYKNGITGKGAKQ